MIGYINELHFKADQCDYKISKLHKEIKEMKHEKEKLEVWCKNIRETLTAELSLSLLAKYKQDIDNIDEKINKSKQKISKLENIKNAYIKLANASEKYK